MKKEIVLTFLVLVLFASSCTLIEEVSEESIQEEGNIESIITFVVDGDTVELNTGERVRLICIDTPERGEYYYQEAREYLENLALNKEVTLIKDVSDTDRYGRLLRYIYFGDTFVNYEMVENGYAKVYRYPPDTSKCDDLEQAEARAKANNLGIWNPPEETTTTTTSSSSSSSVDYVCSSNYYNCDDFSTHEEAQAVFEACGGLSNDVHKLDQDGDALACETLP